METSSIRIRHKGNRIFVGSEEFASASEALQAYIEKFETKRKLSGYHRMASDLLSPKSCLRMAAERSLETGRRDSPEELKLFKTKKEQERTYQKLTWEQDKVSRSLKENSRVLQEINNDRLSPVNCGVSDVESLSTDLLLTISSDVVDHRDLWKRKRDKQLADSSTFRKNSQFMLSHSDCASSHLVRKKLFDESQSRETLPLPSEVNNYYLSSSYKKKLQKALQHYPNMERKLSDFKLIDTSKPKVPSWIESVSSTMSQASVNDMTSIPCSVSAFNHQPGEFRNNINGVRVPSCIENTEMLASDCAASPGYNRWIQWVNNSKDFALQGAHTGTNRDMGISQNTWTPSNIPFSGTKTQEKLRDGRLLDNDEINFHFSDSEDISASDSSLLFPVDQNTDNSEKQKFHSTAFLSKTLNEKHGAPASKSKVKNHPHTQRNFVSKEKSSRNMSKYPSLDTLVLLMERPSDFNIMPETAVPTKGSDFNRNSKSPSTDVILDGDRSWENISFNFQSQNFPEENSPFDDKDYNEYLERKKKTENLNSLVALPEDGHPGSMETLKNTLFKLQQEGFSCLQQEDETSSVEAESQGINLLENSRCGYLEEIPTASPFSDSVSPHFQEGEGTLRSMFHHLTQLQNLVTDGSFTEDSQEAALS